MVKRCEQILLASINKEDCWKIKIISNWSTLVGENLVSQVVLQGIDSGKIFITVKNSCLAQELMLQKNALLKKFNLYLGKTLLHDISFRVGNSLKHKKFQATVLQHKIAQDTKISPTSVINPVINPAETNFVINHKQKQALQKIKSSSLQAILKKLLFSSKKESKKKCK